MICCLNDTRLTYDYTVKIVKARGGRGGRGRRKGSGLVEATQTFSSCERAIIMTYDSWATRAQVACLVPSGISFAIACFCFLLLHLPAGDLGKRISTVLLCQGAEWYLE